MAGLYFYNARYYDSYLNRFLSPDSIIPDSQNVLDWDRYQYVRSNPVNFNDPSGYMVACVNDDLSTGCAGTGMGDLTPSQIVATNTSQIIQDRAIYNYALTHPQYNFGIDAGLEDTGGFIVSNAIFLGNVDSSDRQPNILDRIKSSESNIAFGLSLSFAGAISFGGRLGGPQHQAEVKNIIMNAPNQWGPGYKTGTEIFFTTTGGSKSTRFADVGVFDPQGNLVAIYQVGATTQGGLPVSLERSAITDIFEYGFYKGKRFDGPITFIPYK